MSRVLIFGWYTRFLTGLAVHRLPGRAASFELHGACEDVLMPVPENGWLACPHLGTVASWPPAINE